MIKTKYDEFGNEYTVEVDSFGNEIGSTFLYSDNSAVFAIGVTANTKTDEDIKLDKFLDGLSDLGYTISYNENTNSVDITNPNVTELEPYTPVLKDDVTEVKPTKQDSLLDTLKNNTESTNTLISAQNVKLHNQTEVIKEQVSQIEKQNKILKESNDLNISQQVQKAHEIQAIKEQTEVLKVLTNVLSMKDSSTTNNVTVDTNDINDSISEIKTLVDTLSTTNTNIDTNLTTMIDTLTTNNDTLVSKINDIAAPLSGHLNFLEMGSSSLKDSNGDIIIPREAAAKKDIELAIDKKNENQFDWKENFYDFVFGEDDDTSEDDEALSSIESILEDIFNTNTTKVDDETNKISPFKKTNLESEVS